MSTLALLGGEKSTESIPAELFEWPIVNTDMEDAVLKVLRGREMSGTNITKQFEKEFSEWVGTKYGLCWSNGTASLQAAMFAVGLGVGDEIIVPTITYWASAIQAFSLGASVVFADIDPNTLCLDPNDLPNRLTERTKAIMVVHYAAHPADMDPIMAFAKKHNLKVIEDVSHAHGTLYKGKMTGSIGDAAGFSLMTGKSFAIGEGGIMLTNDQDIHERGLLFGHYARHKEIENPKYAELKGIPWGGVKGRMNQMASAIGLVQLKKYPAEIAEIDKAMNYFWDQVDQLPGLKGIRPAKDSGSTMGGWYACHGLYNPEELNGLSLSRFAEAFEAEGLPPLTVGCNLALHKHPLFSDIDVYGHGKPTQAANLPDGISYRQNEVKFPVADKIQDHTFFAPWFKHFDKENIDIYISVLKKIVDNHKELLPGDKKIPVKGMGAFTKRKG